MYTADDNRYCYRGTAILKNKAGLRSQIELDKFEAVLVSRRMAQPLPRGNMSSPHYCAIHRHLFGDVFSWAGRYRQVSISKGDSEFCQPEYIEREMHSLFDRLADDNYFQDLEPVLFAAKAASFISYLNAIHPFREGNGRTQNIFLALLADQAGHRLDFDLIDPPKLLNAMVAAFYGDEDALATVVLGAMR